MSTSNPQLRRPLLYLLLLTFGIALGVSAFWIGGQLLSFLRPGPAASTDPAAQPREMVANAPLDAEEVEGNGVYESVKSCVVNVDTVLVKRVRFDERLFEQTGTGSGFVWDAAGRIVTNFHVIQDTTRRGNMVIRVVMEDRSAHEALLVGTAPDFDLAVLQIDSVKDKLNPIQVATSADLKVGQKVFAIGNPFGLSESLTTGIISNLDRSIESPTGAPIPGAIQHTAQINPGNSGGPLLNRKGKLIGVNTSIASPSGGNVGIGFSIPSDTVNRVVTEIIRSGGRTQKADLGVRLYDQKRLRSAGYDRGTMIAEVIPGGPADRAKLRGIRRSSNSSRGEPGDLVIAIDGREVIGIDDFQRIVAQLKPGQSVVVRYIRGDDEREAELTVRGI